MANIYMKTYLTTLIIWGMKMKTTVRYYLTSVRMAIIKNTRNNEGWQGCGEKGMNARVL